MGTNSFPRLLRGITITVCLLVTVVTQINVVHAGAKWQAFSWGDVNGTVLSDGVLKICANPFLMNDARFTNYLKHMHRDMTPFFSPMNIVVLDVHGKRVMVDTGSFVPREQRVGAMSHCGALPDSMQEAQIGYDSIDAVMLTHGHPDHIMGLLNSDGEPAFPKANVYISALDHNYFWSGDSEPSGNPMQRQYFTRILSFFHPFFIYFLIFSFFSEQETDKIPVLVGMDLFVVWCRGSIGNLHEIRCTIQKS